MCNSLQIVRGAWWFNLQAHFPNTQPKFVMSRNSHIIWSFDDQGGRISKAQPGWGIGQIKQSTFTCSEIIFNRLLLIKDDCFAFTSRTFQGKIFYIRLAPSLTRRTIFDGSFEFAHRVEV